MLLNEYETVITLKILVENSNQLDVIYDNLTNNHRKKESFDDRIFADRVCCQQTVLLCMQMRFLL